MVNVVKKPFKSNGVFYAVGTIIKDPTAIKLFRQKINDGKVIRVTERNLDTIAHLFEVKFGLEGFKKVLTDELYGKPAEVPPEKPAEVPPEKPVAPLLPPIPSAVPPLIPPIPPVK